MPVRWWRRLADICCWVPHSGQIVRSERSGRIGRSGQVGKVVEIDCEKSMKLETSPKVTISPNEVCIGVQWRPVTVEGP